MKKIIEQCPVIAVLRHLPLEQTVPYVNAAIKGNVRAFEVAMNTPHALEQIKLLRREFSNTNIWIGAGTAITPHHCEDALNARAQFILSPASNVEVLRFCRDNAVSFLPGVMTPSDVELCVNYGFSILKLFPASDLPMGYIKSLKGPFDQTDYVAVGGVSFDNIEQFFQTGFVGVGIGGNLIPKELMLNRQWDDAAAHIAKMMQKVHLKEE